MKKMMICLTAGLLSAVMCTSAFAAKFSLSVPSDIKADMSQAYTRGEHTMIPLRSVAEELGYEVTWNGEEMSVMVANSNVYTKIYIGRDSYYIEEINNNETSGLEMTVPAMVGAAPELTDSRTYVPAVMINMLRHYNDVASRASRPILPMGKISFAVTDKMQINASETYAIGEHTMVPVLKTAENLGYTANYNEEEKSVLIDNGTVRIKIVIGADSYFVECSNGSVMESPMILGAAPEIRDNVIYAPAAMFNLLGRYMITQG